MAVFQMTTTGHESITKKLNAITSQQDRIARSAVSAGLGVFARSARRDTPGSTKREIGKRLKSTSQGAEGRAGLMQYPRRGVRGKQPHAIYLEHGTKFIKPRHVIANALANAQPNAIAAMGQAVTKKIEQLSQ